MCVVLRVAIGFRAGYHYVKLSAVATKVQYRITYTLHSYK